MLIGLSSDFFLHACDELYVHISLLFTSLLVHGYVPDVMSISAVISIPKGRHVNITKSDNYRGITLNSTLIWIFCINITIFYVLVTFNLVLSIIDPLICA